MTYAGRPARHRSPVPASEQHRSPGHHSREPARGRRRAPPNPPWWVRWLGLPLVAVLALVVGLAVGRAPDATTPAAAAATVTVTVPGANAGPGGAIPAASATPGTVLNLHGSGMKQTANFVVARDQWTIAYSYDCARFGAQGNFVVTTYSADATVDDLAVNALGNSATSSTVEHGSGTFYLQIDSECDWQVTVTS